MPQRFSHRISLAGAWYAIVGGAITLLGWLLHLQRLTDWNNSGIAMFVNTALCSVAAGPAILLLRRGRLQNPVVRWTIRGLGLVPLVIGGLTLSQHIFGWNLGIDTLIARAQWGDRAAAFPGRMGPPASSSFFLIGVAIVLSTVRAAPNGRRVATMIALIATVIPSVSLTAYWYGADVLYAMPRLTGIAMQTASILLALELALVFAIPESGLARLMSRDDAAGLLMRHLLVPIVLVLLIFGRIRVLGQERGLYDTAAGTAIFTVALIAVVTITLWSTARAIINQVQRRTVAEAAVERSEFLYRSLVQFASDGIWLADQSGQFIDVNRAACAMLGYTHEEHVALHVRDLIRPDEEQKFQRLMARLAARQAVTEVWDVRCKDGSYIPLELSMTFTPDGRWQAIGRDVSLRKRIEEERERLLDAERSARSEAEHAGRMKDEFLATLSHELRTPLNAILGWSQILARDGMNQDAATLKEGLGVIERNSRAQAQLIEDLLDMSRIISGKVRLHVQQVNLSEVIEAAVDVVTPSALAKGIRLHKVLDPHAGPISGDPNRLQQVVWNLLSNAIKFTDRGGRVRVSLRRVNSHLEIEVADTGEGIAPQFLPHVFERFRQHDASTTRMHAGLGLGLAIVKHLVELHGGKISAHSEGRGKGATFIVELPLGAASPIAPEGDNRMHPTSPAARIAAGDSPDLSRLKVLVVDDEPDAAELVKRILEQCKATVITAQSTNEAIDVFNEVKPDVLVSDIGMPHRDGYELIRAVRQRERNSDKKIPAIALTAFARAEDRMRALQEGYQIHLAKPVEPAELITVVASVAGRLRAGDAHEANSVD